MIDIDFVLTLIFLFFANNLMLNNLAKKHSFFDKKLMMKLLWFHLSFFVIYFIYSIVNGSDGEI